MTTPLRGLALALLAGLAIVFAAALPAQAAFNCACLDGDADGACGNPADIVVGDDDWLKGPLAGLGGNFPGQTFVVPLGCNIVLGTAPKGGVVVNARRIVVAGSVLSTPSGGEGMQFNATEEIVVERPNAQAPKPRLESGGINKLTVNLANAAVAKSSVALRSGGTCRVINAELQGNPVAGSGQVGIRCAGNLELHGSTILAAGVDIQSMTGAILANAGPGGSPGPAVQGIACDNSAVNLTGGNNNSVLDAGDFPCTIDFAAAAAIGPFCTGLPIEPPSHGPNDIRALNNPLVMIAKTNLRLDSTAAPGNLLEGRFLVNLVAEDGTVDTDNAVVTNHNSGPPLGGARIWVFANPTTVNRNVVLKEKSTGPSTGTIEIQGACYVSASPIRIGGTLAGTPAAPPCAQSPSGFQAVSSGP